MTGISIAIIGNFGHHFVPYFLYVLSSVFLFVKVSTLQRRAS